MPHTPEEVKKCCMLCEKPEWRDTSGYHTICMNNSCLCHNVPTGEKCESDGLSYLSNPPQLKCKKCSRFWFAHEETPKCKKSEEINTIFFLDSPKQDWEEDTKTWVKVYCKESDMAIAQYSLKSFITSIVNEAEERASKEQAEISAKFYSDQAVMRGERRRIIHEIRIEEREAIKKKLKENFNDYDMDDIGYVIYKIENGKFTEPALLDDIIKDL